MAAVGDRAILSVQFPGDNVLYISDGTPSGTVVLRDGFRTRRSAAATCSPQTGSSTSGGRLDSAVDHELWRTDGTPQGTKLIKDILPGTRSSLARPIESVNGRVLLVAETPASGRELWVSDGTAAGTQLLKDLVPGALGQPPGNRREDRGQSHLLLSHRSDSWPGTLED